MTEEKQSQEQPMPNMEAPDKRQKDIAENKLITVLSYLGILFLIPLLAKRDSRFAQFHAKQGLVIAIGELLVWFPFFGWLLGIILFIFSIIGIINVLSGKEEKLPIIGDLAEKINI